jgi:hypothetical protein
MLTLTLVLKTLKSEAYNPTPLWFKNSIQQNLKLGELIIEKHLCLVPPSGILCWGFVFAHFLGLCK